MKVIKTKWFAKWAKKNAIGEHMLIRSAHEILDGRYEADFGSGIIKKRVASKGRGKSSSVRTIVAYKHGRHCFFVYGFEKNAKSNISASEEKALKLIGKNLFGFSDAELTEQFEKGALIEVSDEKE